MTRVCQDRFHHGLLEAIFVWVAWMVFSLARSKIIHFRRAEREAGSQPRNAGIDNGRNS